MCFIDAVDAVAPAATARGASGGEGEEQALNQLLVETDALERSSGVVVIAATNRPQIVEPGSAGSGATSITTSACSPRRRRAAGILAIQANGRPLRRR